MRSYIITLVIILLLNPFSHAQEKILSYEKLLNYEEVVISKVTPSKILIVHKKGAASIAIEDLPESVRGNLGMTPEKAKKHRKLLVERRKKMALRANIKRTLARNRLYFTGSVFQVTEGGVLLNEVCFSNGTKEKIKIFYQVKTGGPTSLSPNRSYRYTTKSKTKWVLKVREMNYWPIFVRCDTTGYVDGSRFSDTVYADGTFSYTSTHDAKKTIPAYTTNTTEVLKRAKL